MIFNALKRQLPVALAYGIFGYAYTPKHDAKGRRKSARRSNCVYFNWSASSEETNIRCREASPEQSRVPFREIWGQQRRKNKGCESFFGASIRNSKESSGDPLVSVKIDFRVVAAIIPKYPRCALIAMAGVFSAIQKETSQSHDLRKPYLKKIGALRGGRAVVSCFITFYGEYPLHQKDADMLEEILAHSDRSKGVTLILDAPGGDALAAERIIQICRNYSGNDFETIVPARAKSAATMVCLGADKILMSRTSELGPIDTQVYMGDEKSGRWLAAHHIITTYDKLFSDAVALQQGQIEPYLQQLGRLNAVEIQELKSQQALGLKIAASSLQRGMLKGKTDTEIEKLIEPFTNPELTLSHGRALNHEQVTNCGLNVEMMELDSELWKTVWALYVRSNYVVDATNIAKLVETYNVVK